MPEATRQTKLHLKVELQATPHPEETVGSFHLRGPRNLPHMKNRKVLGPEGLQRKRSASATVVIKTLQLLGGGGQGKESGKGGTSLVFHWSDLGRGGVGKTLLCEHIPTTGPAFRLTENNPCITVTWAGNRGQLVSHPGKEGTASWA